MSAQKADKIQMRQPQFTIITAVLNQANTLHRCLESVISQTLSDKELIVIDGGSTDGSVDIIKSLQYNITHWESARDNGIYHAWNKALTHAKGEWICFLGADDYFWNDQVLTDMAPELIKASRNSIRIVYGQVARVDKQDRIVSLWGKPWEKIRWQMKHGMPKGMPHCGLMHHCTLFQDHGLFDERFRVVGDYEFLLRELINPEAKALYVPHTRTVGHQIGGISDLNIIAGHNEMARARRKNGLGGFSWFWLMVHIRAIVRDQWRKWRQK